MMIFQAEINFDGLRETQGLRRTGVHKVRRSVAICSVTKQSAKSAQPLIDYHNDHLGTPQVMTSSTGAVVWKATYNAFGNATVDASSTITNNLRFPGQYYDAETGLHYNWNRYYDPNTGRYITADPIGLEGGINLFNYANDNPTRFVDWNGLAYFAKRALHGLPWMGTLSCSPNSIDDLYNTEVSHEQLFFEDGKQPSNVGFFDDGSLKTEPNSSGYRCKSAHYNDCVMRKAVQNVPLSPYHLLNRPGVIQNNCQDWADAVRREYNRLMKDPKIKCECEK